jgi:uncharacterized protein YbaP (TraB family)
MIKRFLAGLFATSVAFTPVYAQEPRPDLDPAVWVVKDADTTIYLFGTVHVLDGKGDWLNDEVKTSFDASSELVLEIITPEDPAAMAPLLQKYALDTSGKPLTQKLSPKHQKLFAERLTKLGMPATALDMFRPFFAAMTLSVVEMQQLGFNPESGAEKILTKAAKDKGMKIGEVENIDMQMQMLNALPEAEQIRMLEKSLDDDSGKAMDTIKRLIAAWGKGDPDTVAKIMNEDEADSKALYELLLVNRNKNWAEWIDNRLDQPGTVFMAVGAGHLAGDESVQRFLKDRGIASTRVPQPAQ